MARIRSHTFSEMNFTMHRVQGLLRGDDLRETARAFYAHNVTLNVLWDFTGADLTCLPSDELRQIVSEVKDYTHSRSGGRTAFVVAADVNFGLGRMVEMVSESMKMPFEFRSFKSLNQAAGWLDVDLAAVLDRFPDDES